MQAIICNELGENENNLRLEKIPPPPLRPGSVRIATAAAGVNFADGLLIKGQYQVKATPPFSPGFEIAGNIAEIADNVKGFNIGQPVMAVLDQGGFAEEAVVAAEDVFPLPSGMDMVMGAGFPIVWGTSHHALTNRAKLRPGQTLLVHGAAGGVGLTAVAIGHALGTTVIATAGGSEKLKAAAAQGADHVLDYRHCDLRQEVRTLTRGRGVDVVYDPVGGEVFEASLRCMVQGGTLLVIGFASGKLPQIPANILLVKNLSVMGYYWGAWRKLDPQGLKETFAELARWYEQGLIVPEVPMTLPLCDAPKALTALKERRVIGKQVLRIRA